MNPYIESVVGHSRRTFIKKTALGAAGLAVATSARSYAQIVGANDRIRVAVIGLKRRGIPHLISLCKMPNVEVTYICEVDSVQMEKGLEAARQHSDRLPKTETDYRRIVEKSDVDAVFLATPDHWHAYGALLALKHGKHVYVEKPCSHNLAEDDLLMAAEKKFPDLKIQMGSQRRSSPEITEVIQAIHGGVIGDPYKALAFYTNSRGRVPNPKEVDPPANLNWDLWQGPAPRRQFLDIIADYNWHWDWHWGTAESANNGTHEMDVGRWALGVTYPELVQAESGKFHFVDDGWQMYDTMLVTFRFPGNKVLQWDGASRNGYQTYGAGRGTIIYGTGGSVFVNQDIYRIYDRDGKLLKERVSEEQEGGVVLGGGGGVTDRHILNFLEAIRGNASLTAPMAIGAVSTHLTHNTNISSRMSDARLEIDPQTGKFMDQSV
ncbi:MAG TPA: Gfo/Idh/MocA family oxidoreductase, partial [Oceanipulchritudo sp.]|nr:Gfo/Idh/MocA family oxidoreductase [Oceanipulchritudo sp.]